MFQSWGQRDRRMASVIQGVWRRGWGQEFWKKKRDSVSVSENSFWIWQNKKTNFFQFFFSHSFSATKLKKITKKKGKGKQFSTMSLKVPLIRVVLFKIVETQNVKMLSSWRPRLSSGHFCSHLITSFLRFLVVWWHRFSCPRINSLLIPGVGRPGGIRRIFAITSRRRITKKCFFENVLLFARHKIRRRKKKQTEIQQGVVHWCRLHSFFPDFWPPPFPPRLW